MLKIVFPVLLCGAGHVGVSLLCTDIPMVSQSTCEFMNKVESKEQDLGEIFEKYRFKNNFT